MINKKNPDGKRRILSIIANEFTYNELKLELDVRCMFLRYNFIFKTYNSNIKYLKFRLVHILLLKPANMHDLLVMVLHHYSNLLFIESNYQRNH